MHTVAIGAFLTSGLVDVVLLGRHSPIGRASRCGGTQGRRPAAPTGPVPLSSSTGRERRVPGAGQDHDTEGGNRDGEHAERKE